MSRAAKKLTDEDRVLWSLVAKSAKPLKGRKPVEDEPPTSAVEEKIPSAAAVSAATLPAPAPPKRQLVSHVLDRATLDKLSRGRLPIEGRVDLHGMTQSEAHSLLLSFLQRAHAGGVRYVLVITGKGFSSGGDGDIKAPGAGLAVDSAFPRAGVEPRFGGAPARRRGRALHPPAKGSMTSLGEELRELRRRKGVSQKEMAAAIGVSAAYLVSARARAPRRADMGAAAEDHRLLQCDLGRRRRVAAAGGTVASSRRHRHVRPVAGGDRTGESARRADRHLDARTLEELLDWSMARRHRPRVGTTTSERGYVVGDPASIDKASFSSNSP